MREATRQLTREREEMAAKAAADRELRDEAFAAADVMASQVDSLKSEIERLSAELQQSKAYVTSFLEVSLAERMKRLQPNEEDEAEGSHSREFFS